MSSLSKHCPTPRSTPPGGPTGWVSRARGVRIFVVRDPLDPVLRALALAVAASGYPVEVAGDGDREATNSLVADIWDAGGRIHAGAPL